MAKLSDFQNAAPYDAEYVDVMDILNKPLILKDAEVFENAKGKGVHALVEIDGDELRVCTHGVAIVDLLGRQEVQDALKSGQTFKCRFVQQPSKADKSRKVLRLVDEEDA